MLPIDIHTHTVASGHGTTDTIADLAKSAYQKGMTLIGISDHGPATPGSCRESYFRMLKTAPRNRAGVTVLYGAEANILDPQGNLDMTERDMRYLDVVIASLHPHCMQPGTKAENTAAYLHAMDNP